jgi:cell division protein FtsZ
VATGIDASAANRAETPVTRRSMAAPLPSFVAPEQRRDAPLTGQAAPAPAPAPVQEPIAPTLFETAEAQDDAGYDDAPADELPLPVYRPQPAAQPVPQPTRARVAEDTATGFVAPRPRPAGQPSPEALARLQAAVSRAPTAARPAAPATATAPAPAARPAAERPRFGIGSLINRMAGHASDPAPERNPAPRAQPQASHYDDEPEMGADQERIEIPAFLRRQAN